MRMLSSSAVCKAQISAEALLRTSVQRRGELLEHPERPFLYRTYWASGLVEGRGLVAHLVLTQYT